MKRNLSWRALLALMAGLALILAACGDDEEGSDDTTTTTAAADDETTTTAPADDAAADDAGSGIGVTLNDDFELLLASDPVAGSVTFNVSNEGPEFPHALVVVRAASLDDLPRKEANGAVDTDTMDAADIIGSTTVPLDPGVAEDLTVDLEAGDYVIFCPVQNETRSHVAAGQFIEVTIGG